MMILLCLWSYHCLHLTLGEKYVGVLDGFISLLNKYEKINHTTCYPLC
jgi:hypothetical protein